MYSEKSLSDSGSRDANLYKIISIGSNCTCKYSLNLMNIKQETYPFDWILTYDPRGISNLLDRTTEYLDFKRYNVADCNFSNGVNSEILKQYFACIDKALLIKLYKEYQDHKQLTDVVDELVIKHPTIQRSDIELFLNTIVFKLEYDGITFVHDHKFSLLYDKVKEKYERRINRFHSLKNEDRVIFIRHNIGKDDRIVYTYLLNKFADKFILIEINEGNEQMTHISDNYYRIFGNLYINSYPFHKILIEQCLESIKLKTTSINL